MSCPLCNSKKESIRIVEGFSKSIIHECNKCDCVYTYDLSNKTEIIFKGKVKRNG